MLTEYEQREFDLKDAEIATLKELLESHRQQYSKKCEQFIASENARVMNDSLLEAIEFMIEGEIGKNEPSDFMMSFGIVRDVWDFFQHYEVEIAILKERVRELEESKWYLPPACAVDGKGKTWTEYAHEVFAENQRLRKILSLALPHIECSTKEQDNLITAIGEAVEGK